MFSYGQDDFEPTGVFVVKWNSCLCSWKEIDVNLLTFSLVKSNCEEGEDSFDCTSVNYDLVVNC